MTEFFYLKLGRGNCLAKYWLNEEKRPNLYNRPVATIYFGTNTVEDIRKLTELYTKGGSSKKEAREKFKEKLKEKYAFSGNKVRRPDFEAAMDFVKVGDNSGEKLNIFCPVKRLWC